MSSTSDGMNEYRHNGPYVEIVIDNSEGTRGMWCNNIDIKRKIIVPMVKCIPMERLVCINLLC
jgi:hypothetical protein